MSKYSVSIECNPKNHDQWFPGQHLIAEDGINANSLSEAQDKLDAMCREAGSDNDPYFVAHGPAACAPAECVDSGGRRWGISQHGDVVYRIPGHRHGDGQQDTPDNQVWLLSDEDSLPDGIEIDDLPGPVCVD